MVIFFLSSVSGSEVIVPDLYLVDKPKKPAERQQNKEALKFAETIKAKRELEIKNGQYGFTSGQQSNANVIAYFKAQAEKRLESKGNYGNWDSSIKHLVAFAGEGLTFKQFDATFCERFRDYLKNEKRQTPVILVRSLLFQ